MKSKHVFSLVALCALSILPMRADIHFSVQVNQPTARQVVVVYQTTIVEIPLNAQGQGAYTFKNIPGVHAQVFYGMDARPIFLEDGDSIALAFDGASFKEKVDVKMRHPRVFEYLNKVTLPDVDQQKMALPLAEYQAYVQKREAQALRIFKAWKLDEESALFSAIEKGRIKYAYASSLMMYVVGHPMLTQDATWKPDTAYYNMVKSYAVPQVELVNLKEYREYMKEVARMFGCERNTPLTPYNRTLCEMNYIIDNIEVEPVREALLTMLAIEQVEQYGIEGIDDLMTLMNTFVTDTVLTASFKEKYDAWDVTQVGKPSPDFRAEGLDGRFYTLGAFKGKYVYIDLWATWCGPCRKEMPFLKQLEKEYEGKNIIFLSLSTDAKRADWLKAVAPQGVEAALQAQPVNARQLFLGVSSRFQKAYKADGIPHFILIDPQGCIVNPNMLRPSSPDVKVILDKLL